MSTNARSTTFPGASELAALMRGTDWSKTSLGPVEQWPNGLRTAVQIVLTSQFSMWMAWGAELAFLYNDAYRRDTLGSKHPRALGTPTRELWSEIWDDIGPRISSVLRDGVATWDENLLLMLERSDYREETYHTFSYSPLFDDDGSVRGILSVVTEVTARLIAERRVTLLSELARQIGGVNTVEDVASGLERALATESRDLPFTLTYLGGDEAGALRLIASTGFAATHAEPPAVLAAEHPWLAGRVPDVAHVVELPPGHWPSGTWSVAPARVFVAPLAARGQTAAAGVLVCGLNPHRTFDRSYADFLTLLANQLAAGLANARAYAQERERAESLANLDRAKTVFFSNVSHELRTPLTLILAPLADMLAEPSLSPAATIELETMHRNGLRLQKLVNTMLDFSRLEAGRATAQLAPVDLARETADLASMFRAATEKVGLELVVACAPLDVPVLVDRDMWEKIVLNLLSNAFKFTLEGQIFVGLERRGDRAVLTVRDTGTGIPASEMQHVFDRFHRVEGARGRTHEGTGIGLALVQELVRIHGGTIEVASELGRGTAFTVAIPIRSGDDHATEELAASRAFDASAAPNPYVAEALRWLPGEPRSAASGRELVAGEYLLVADDNADMRAYLERLLGARWAVRIVGDGAAALRQLRACRPALLLADVMMPELDGFGLLAAVRAEADPELANLPVIMLSARAGDEARVEGLNAGANDYLVKPFSPRELIARVESQLLRTAVRAAEHEQLRRIGTIFEQAPVAMALLRGPQHVFELANPRYRAIVKGRDVLGRPLAEALPEVVPQGFLALLDRVYASGEPFLGTAMPIQLLGEDGVLQERTFDLVYQPMFDSDGTVIGIAAIGHDVTAVTTARRDAEQANRSKDEFLAMLGHELRNPLAPILTALQLMQLRSDGGTSRERAVIERQVSHLVGLVDDLLDISRITQGKVELRKQHVELADVIAQSVELASPLLEQHAHALTLEVPAGLRVDGDPARLAQIFSNLLTNAAKYTPAGGRIAVHARCDDDADGTRQLVVRVIDNGIGMDAAMLPRIFAPFTQSRQAIDRSSGGLGLGLAIVDNLVRLHGGSVTAVSAGAGQGSELTVRLPAVTSRPNELVARPAAALQAGTARVLGVDDNVDAAEMLAAMLEATGYETATAHDGPSALETLDRFEADLAVLDLGLPVMDGFELARHILQRARAPRLIALTGYGQPDDRARTAAAGFSLHFVKPVSAATLRTAMERLLAPQ